MNIFQVFMADNESPHNYNSCHRIADPGMQAIEHLSNLLEY